MVVIIVLIVVVKCTYYLYFQTINSSFDDVDRLSSIDSFDPKSFRNNLNGHDADIETSDYVSLQIDIKLLILIFHTIFKINVGFIPRQY